MSREADEPAEARGAPEDDAVGAAPHEAEPRDSEPVATEVVRASPELADIATSLVLSLFARHRLFRSDDGLSRLLLAPAPTRTAFARLREMLFDLVARPEWRARHAVAREVSDEDGLRLELLLPLSSADYRGGPALVGPFADELSATEWGEDHARADVSFDTFFTGSAWVCDLFVLPTAGAADQGG